FGGISHEEPSESAVQRDKGSRHSGRSLKEAAATEAEAGRDGIRDGIKACFRFALPCRLTERQEFFARDHTHGKRRARLTLLRRRQRSSIADGKQGHKAPH